MSEENRTTENEFNTEDINSKSKSLVPEDDYSIHERIEQIFKDTEVDRKTQISKRIKYGDTFFQIALSVAFWGFWIYWLIIFLT